MILDAEQTLSLDAASRKQTLIRVDAGGGSRDEVNWVLGRGYQIHCKDISGARAEALPRRRQDLGQ
jgi:hypothetical protein